MGGFSKISKDIKSLKIQGATKIAKSAIKAYSLKPTKYSIKLLLSLRPTEPAMFNALHLAKNHPTKAILAHFDKAQEKINALVYKIVNGKKLIFTHCHSNAVSLALIYSNKKGAKFEVYNTETRPLYQGRITSKQLSKAGIKVTEFVDSGMHEAIKKCHIVLLGADAILKTGVINKIGSAIVAEIAKVHHKPLYIVSDSWKFYPKKVRIEQRSPDEIWKRNIKNLKITNPAFELIPKNQISKIVSELGVLSYAQFLKKSKRVTLSEH